MTWGILKTGTVMWLSSDIDSSGMSVCWTPERYADTYETRSQAESMLKRVLERYPNEKCIIEEMLK